MPVMLDTVSLDGTDTFYAVVISFSADTYKHMAVESVHAIAQE